MSNLRTVILLWIALATLASAQGTLPCDAPAQQRSGAVFHLPLEVGGGLILGREGTTPFTASLRLHPSIGLLDDALRIGPSGGFFYENPAWMGLLGGRVSYRLWNSELLPMSSAMSVHLAGEGLARIGSGGGAQVSGAVVFNLGEVIAISLRGARDLHRKETLLELSLSSDIVTWFPKEERLPVDTTHRVSTLRTLYEVETILISSQYKAIFAGNQSMANTMRAQLVNGSSALMTARTIAAMKAALDAAGLSDISAQVDGLINRAKSQTQMQLGGTGVLPNPIDERMLAQSFIEGWCQALRTPQ